MVRVFYRFSRCLNQRCIQGSWYKGTELGKRGAIFSSSAQVATIFSGVLQGSCPLHLPVSLIYNTNLASIYKNLNGLHGLAGFKWLFIICEFLGCILEVLLTLPRWSHNGSNRVIWVSVFPRYARDHFCKIFQSRSRSFIPARVQCSQSSVGKTAGHFASPPKAPNQA